MPNSRILLYDKSRFFGLQIVWFKGERGRRRLESLKLYFVDDEPIILEGLVHTYDWENLGFAVAGAAVNSEKALQEIREKRPDVVISDFSGHV